MSKVGKLIMVRLPGPFPLLKPATAIAVGLDGKVVISQPICGECMFPPEMCFEFEPDLMDAVNGLVYSAIDKVEAARQLADVELRQAVLDNHEVSEGTVYH